MKCPRAAAHPAQMIIRHSMWQLKNNKNEHMKTIKFSCFVFLLASIFFLAGCGSESSEVENEEVTITENVDPEHNARISLDFLGVYSGILPCADCEGVETQLTLNADETYMLSSKYIGKGGGQPFQSKGSYSWKDGNTIELSGVTDGAFLYKVQENKLVQLDLEGNLIEGEIAAKYELQKMN